MLSEVGENGKWVALRVDDWELSMFVPNPFLASIEEHQRSSAEWFSQLERMLSVFLHLFVGMEASPKLAFNTLERVDETMHDIAFQLMRELAFYRRLFEQNQGDSFS